MSTYLVTGRTAYREHTIGSTFDADLDPAAERRAIQRGAIQLVERSTTSLRPGSYRLPAGWVQHGHHQEEARE